MGQEFWHDAPDCPLAEGESFDNVIEPLKRSILEPQREGPPFTVQRICELLVDPRHTYKSTRRYIYALQRVVLIRMTEEVFTHRPQEPVLGNDGASAGRKRKLPPEAANGVVGVCSQHGALETATRVITTGKETPLR